MTTAVSQQHITVQSNRATMLASLRKWFDSVLTRAERVRGLKRDRAREEAVFGELARMSHFCAIERTLAEAWILKTDWAEAKRREPIQLADFTRPEATLTKADIAALHASQTRRLEQQQRSLTQALQRPKVHLDDDGKRMLDDYKATVKNLTAQLYTALEERDELRSQCKKLEKHAEYLSNREQRLTDVLDRKNAEILKLQAALQADRTDEIRGVNELDTPEITDELVTV